MCKRAAARITITERIPAGKCKCAGGQPSGGLCAEGLFPAVARHGSLFCATCCHSTTCDHVEGNLNKTLPSAARKHVAPPLQPHPAKILAVLQHASQECHTSHAVARRMRGERGGQAWPHGRPTSSTWLVCACVSAASVAACPRFTPDHKRAALRASALFRGARFRAQGPSPSNQPRPCLD